MRTTFHLNETDIKKVIAAHFAVPIEAVSLHQCTVTKGYGLDEHEVTEVSAIIEKPVSIERVGH